MKLPGDAAAGNPSPQVIDVYKRQRHGRLSGNGSSVPPGSPQHMHQMPPRPKPPDQPLQRQGHSIHVRFTEILLAQAKLENPNKPENIIEKMIIGRLNKEMKEICLLDQIYVQDGDLTVAKYVEKVAKENGANMTVKKFVRFETGEGIEKKEEDFAAEVAKQMAGN